MGFKIKKAEPIDGRLLIALAGPQASGKTTSALRLAAGITSVSGGKICLIDTENNRALRYAESFDFNHMEFQPPFSPTRYLEAIKAATDQGYKEGDVIIIDSMTHEHDGDGGVLSIHEKFLNDKAGNDWSKRERLKFTAWIKPKADRTRVVQMGLQRNRAHVILCFRAKEKVKMVKNNNGKTEVLSDGWQPIGGDEYFFEMDITMILPQGSQGKPDWGENAARINEYGQDSLRKSLHATQQISEETGRFLANWSKKTDPLKSLALELARELRNCSSIADVDYLLSGRSSDFDKLKTGSVKAYDFLMKERDKKLEEFQIEKSETSVEEPIKDTNKADCSSCGGRGMMEDEEGKYPCPDCNTNP